MTHVPPTSAVGPERAFGRGELVLLGEFFYGSRLCRRGWFAVPAARRIPPGRRVTFFWRPRRKSPKKRASIPSSKWSQPCGCACDSRGGGWTGRGASSVDRGPEPSLLVVGARTASDRPDPVRWQGRRACSANRRAQATGRPKGPISVPSCPASSSGSGPRSTLLAPRPVHPPHRVAPAMHEARDSLELGIQALFFGDFLLGPQKKVTRPPGRIPGALPARQTTPDGEAANQGKLGHDERVHQDRRAAQGRQRNITCSPRTQALRTEHTTKDH
jgi:hypothetical protein